ncbi:hypothetical protein GYMLUDRAFT_82548 [Collybiopsis luxurians FD-317 M1]|nr:hypothetical protein GYMLUDRAFT_82548 [Collybiopsis luxurians FD-317 M1]
MNSTTPQTAVVLPSELLTGPLIPALSISCMLFTTLTIQVGRYLNKFPRDAIVFKLVVGMVYLLVSAQLILMHEFCWDVFVTGIGVKGGHPTPQVGTAVHTMLTGIVAGIVQIFFAWRVYSLRKKSVFIKLVAALIVLLALEQGASCVSAVALFLHAGSNSSSVALLKHGSNLDLAWLIGAVICDLIIATAMTIILIGYSRASTIPHTQTLLRRLIARSVETGTVTFVFQLINSVLFELYTNTYVYMIFDRSISSLYANALLLSLNARKFGTNVHTMSWDTTDHSSFRLGSRGDVNDTSYRLTTRGGGSSLPLHITKQTVTDTHIDRETLTDSHKYPPAKAPSDFTEPDV